MDTNVIEIPKSAFLDRPSRHEEAKALSFSDNIQMQCEENAIMRYTLHLYKVLAGHPDGEALIELVNCSHIVMMREIGVAYFSDKTSSSPLNIG
jgi:hypothetical protein